MPQRARDAREDRGARVLDKAIGGVSDGKLEPIFLGTAGKIAEHLHFGLMEWLEANRTFAIDGPVRIALFAAGAAFLHSIGADGVTTITALTALVLKRAPAAGKRTGGKIKQVKRPARKAETRGDNSWA